MKLIYDMRHLTGRSHGMARYAIELLRAMLAREQDLGVGVLLFRQEHSQAVPLDRRIVNIVTGLPPYGPKAQWFLPGLLNKLAMDVYHCPFYAPPARFKGPMVFTIHDLIHLRFPRDHGFKHRFFWRWVVGPAARRAGAIFSVSRHTQKDLVKILGVPSGKVLVTPNGVGPEFRPLGEKEVRSGLEAAGLTPGYILGVGNPKPHKNLAALAKARRLLGDDSPPLVLAGVGPGEVPGIEPGPSLTLLGDVEGSLLPAIYCGARMVVMPSFYEGFGLPALEALACGTPLVASDRASLPEVVGQAGLLAAPDPPALARAMGRILAEPELAADLRRAGPIQARKFTWEETAKKTLAAYRRVAAEKGSGR